MAALERYPVAGGRRAEPELDRHTFLRPVAHRGLHDSAQLRLENTAPAFRAAIDKHYGIECDLQPAEDGTPMVFHDERLERLVAATGPIATYSPAKLAKFRYKGVDQKILSFAQFLDLVAGRVPVLAEVKGKKMHVDAVFLDKIAWHARAYKGPIALMSFNRTIVTELRERAPRVPRGVIIGSQQVLTGLWRGKATRSSSGFAHVFAAGGAGIAFYAVDVKLVAVARKWISRHAPELPLFTWTVRTPRQRAAAARWADAPIFEGYEA